MILISKNSMRLCNILITVCFFCVLLLPTISNAQQSLSLSVSPTLFEMSANPGQLWQSSVKVINSNAFDMTVYASVVNFTPQGETGQGKLLPVFEKMTEGSTLAEWVIVDSKPFVIEREQSISVPFSVEVPEDASPGGHFAAILISTQPPEPVSGSLSVRTAQIVTSLFFVRVAGDINESGTIRTFTTAKSFLQKPEATFELRFENKGNVHLQPRGDIRIFNMWGTERGIIPINHTTHFGNVLPSSIRKFEFSWTGEQSISDIGRYKAEASLAYGLGDKQFVTSATYFWVIPIKSMIITIGSIVIFFLLMIWAIKLYVRRMLQMAGIETSDFDRSTSNDVPGADVRIRSYKTVSAPVRSGYLDLRTRISSASAFVGKFSAVISFIGTYKKFFAGLAIVGVGTFGFYYFISDATDGDKSYDVTISNPGSELNLSSEEIIFTKRAAESGVKELGSFIGKDYELTIVNTSGVAGTAADVAIDLMQADYGVDTLNPGEGRVDKRTVVVYDPRAQDTALLISKFLKGALLSARTGDNGDKLPNITVYVGIDRISD